MKLGSGVGMWNGRDGLGVYVCIYVRLLYSNETEAVRFCNPPALDLPPTVLPSILDPRARQYMLGRSSANAEPNDVHKAAQAPNFDL